MLDTKQNSLSRKYGGGHTVRVFFSSSGTVALVNIKGIIMDSSMKHASVRMVKIKEKGKVQFKHNNDSIHKLMT